MNKKQIKDLINVLNSTSDMGMKYPIGNKELTVTVRQLESEGKIRYQPHYGKWTDKPISYKGNNNE